ncbi:MAG TPA: DNA gyrase modulator, partial [Propionibacteriaceae bacterium]|nr:DNA gyrase modulator [Propionibacteriaceae bacterium]
MPDLDASFLALPLAELSDAALSRAKELGCSHAEIRVERLREAFRTFRDHGLETTADRQVLGLSVRVVHDGVWGFAADIALTPDAAARLADRAVATARVSRPLTPASVVLAEEDVYPDATWMSAYEVDPFAVDEADKINRLLELNEVLLAAPGVGHATAMLAYVAENKYLANLAGTTTTQQRMRIQAQLT